MGLETGDDKLKAEAFTYVNEVRARAGATLHQMVNNPEDLGMEKYGFPVDENLQYIRDERARELCFENLRIYDLRRWRVADIDFMGGKQPHTLLPYYVLNENKWIFLNEVPVVARKATFDKNGTMNRFRVEKSARIRILYVMMVINTKLYMDMKS